MGCSGQHSSRVWANCGRCVGASQRRHSPRHRPRLLRSVVAHNRTAQQVYLLVAVGIDGQVDESALNLRPFVPRLSRQPIGVLVEGLVEDAHDHQSVVAARGDLGKLLEEVDVGAVVGGRLQEFPHLVDKHHQAAAGTGVLGGDLTQGVQDLHVAPADREAGGEPAGFHRLAYHLGGTLPAPDDWKDLPALAARGQGVPDDRCGLLAEGHLRRLPQRGVTVQEGAEGHRQTGFPAAVGSGPSERPLPALGDVARHGL